MGRFEDTRSLYTPDGRRKYMTRRERDVFLRAADTLSPEKNLLCQTLAYTGCRLSEALALTPLRIDTETGTVVFETLKKRRRSVFREVPAPSKLITSFHRIYGMQLQGKRFWPVHRQTAWRWVSEAMHRTEFSGPHATPKGLRHGFAVHAIRSGVPTNIIQKWLGHSRLETTSIYINVMGQEERELAAKMWGEPATIPHNFLSECV